MPARDVATWRALPKVDLHHHLDGSLRPSTVHDIALKAGRPWPPDGETRCRVPSDCASLHEFLKTFDFFLPYLDSREALRRAAREAIEDQHADGVVYVETRFAPTLWLEAGFPAEEAVEAALEGLREGAASTGVKWGLILCGLRNFDPSRTQVAVDLALRYRDAGVVGVDIAGDERRSLQPHAEAFRSARRHGIPVTLHAGEAGPASNVREALELGAIRIGHGVHAIEDPSVVAEVRRRGATLEMCLTSNLRTHAVERIGAHPFPGFLRDGVRVTLNTDDPGVQASTLSEDFAIAAREFTLEKRDLLEVVRNGIDAAWVDEAARAELRRRVNDRWDAPGRER